MLWSHMELGQGPPVSQKFIYSWLQSSVNPVETLLFIDSIRPISANETVVKKEGEDIFTARQIATRHLFVTRVDHKEWVLVALAEIEHFSRSAKIVFLFYIYRKAKVVECVQRLIAVQISVIHDKQIVKRAIVDSCTS